MWPHPRQPRPAAGLASGAAGTACLSTGEAVRPARKSAATPRGPRGDALLRLQVRGTLALLCVSAVTLTYALWQALSSSARPHVRPEEGPTASCGLGSSLAWAPLGGEAWRHQQNDSCR